MPTILNDMGYTSIQAQLHSVPPYVVACVLSITVAFVSDRTRRRGVYLAGFAVVAIIGFALLRSPSIKSLGVKYFAIFLVATGCFPGGPGFLSWAMNSIALFLTSVLALTNPVSRFSRPSSPRYINGLCSVHRYDGCRSRHVDLS
jgi:MFS family permease